MEFHGENHFLSIIPKKFFSVLKYKSVISRIINPLVFHIYIKCMSVCCFSGNYAHFFRSSSLPIKELVCIYRGGDRANHGDLKWGL